MKQVYEQLHNRFGEILSQTLQSEHYTALARNHAFIHDLEVWLDVLKPRPEALILQEAIKEYQFALVALMQGSYRHGFMSLRLFMELTLVSVFLSADLVSLHEWLQRRADTKWSVLIDVENGLFSKRFAKAFFAELAPFAMSQKEMAEKVYRECSQFVHGNPETSTREKVLNYDDGLVLIWIAKADVISDLVTFAFCLRYLRDLDEVALSRIESSTMKRLEHFSEIRTIFGGTATR